MARHMLMKLNNYKGHNLGPGYYASEKLDGIRVFWDGGMTRGMVKADVPFANTVKDGRYVNVQMATGLWTQYGNPVFAPDWWLDDLPQMMMEGELYTGRQNWQTLSSIVKKQVPEDDGWRTVRFVAFDMPDPKTMFKPGKINMFGNTSIVWRKDVYDFFADNVGDIKVYSGLPYSTRRHILRNNYPDVILEQLFYSPIRAYELLTAVTEKGGEGVVLKSQDNLWTPNRVNDCLKIKPTHTAEAVFVGTNGGKGKYIDMIGNYVCRLPNGIEFELSGMTDHMRQYENAPEAGAIIEFKYRELSDTGVPKEARFVRVRGEV